MQRGRTEAFSDGVIAIIITIMVLQLTPPAGDSLGSLKGLVPGFISYVVSFMFVGTFWNNHHHLFQVLERVNGKILWSNLLFLFTLSLVPVSTDWVSRTGFGRTPVTVYILINMAVTFSYILLQYIIVHAADCVIIKKIVVESKKETATVLLQLAALLLSLFAPAPFHYLFLPCLIGVVLLWLIPDLRIARAIDMKVCEREDAIEYKEEK